MIVRKKCARGEEDGSWRTMVRSGALLKSYEVALSQI